MKIYSFYENEVLEMEVEDRGHYLILPKRHPAFNHALQILRGNACFSKRELLEGVYSATENEIEHYQEITSALQGELNKIKKKYAEVFDDQDQVGGIIL